MSILKVEHLSKIYGKGDNEVVALNDVINRQICIC